MTAKRSFALSALCLVLLTFFAHGSALSGWWRWDDPEHLVVLAKYSPIGYFFVPSVWHQISLINFTPLLNFSLYVDLQLFGAEPLGFYVHQLVSLCAAAIVSLSLFQLWLPRRWALLAVSLFLLGTPTFAVAQQLMSRHYIEGLALFCAALYCFVVAVRNNSAGYAWLGGLCYLLAMLCKEIYAPLIGFLPFLLEGNWRERCRKGVPFLLAAVVYIVWRLFMLDTPVRGYVSFSAFDLLRCLRNFFDIPKFFWGRGWLAVTAVLMSCGVTAWALWRRPRSICLFIVGLVLLLLPLVPLTLKPDLLPPADGFDRGRFLLLTWWSVCFVTVLSLHVAVATVRPLLFKRSLEGIFLIAVFGAVLHHAWVAPGRLREGVARQEMYGKFVWNADAGQVLLLPQGEYLWYSKLLSNFRELSGSVPPLIISDEIQLALLDLNSVAVNAYDPACNCIVDITAQVPSILEVWRGRLVDRPLELDAHFDRQQQHFSWRLGPYTDGQYSLVSSVAETRILPPVGIFEVVTDFDLGVVVLRYDAPDGTISYSKPLRFTEDGIEWLPEYMMRPER